MSGAPRVPEGGHASPAGAGAERAFVALCWAAVAFALLLQAAGVIHYSRGRITILDRAKLEQQVCECYGVVKKEFDRLLPNRPQPTAATADRR